MKKIIIISFLLQIVFSGYSYSQFSNVLFRKYLNLDWNSESRVLALGDQNGDGYDDFLLHGAPWADTFMIYMGGETIDTNSAMLFNNRVRGKIAVDINHDGIKDILVNSFDSSKVSIYYGGQYLDTIPDCILPHPESVSLSYGVEIKNIGDFNGDGYEDIVFIDYYLPNSTIQKSIYYICSTYPEFDLIPEMIIRSDTSKNIRVNDISSGDLDGDGKSDLMLRRHIGETINENVSILIIRGNSSWDTTSVQSFYQKEQTFNLRTMRILGDINNDKRADVLLYSYANYYPYWTEMSIIYGGIPLDTIPDVGINTQNMGFYPEKSMIVGDVNGDGYNDIIQVAANFGYPVMKIFLGGKNMNNHNLPVLVLGGSSNFYGGLIGRIGDVNGDGVDDFLIGTATKTGMSIFGFCEILSGDSSIIVNGIEEGSEGEKPEGFQLYDPYPNPFNPETVISYQLPVNSKVTLTIYDILGKEVTKVVDKEQEAGKYQITFDAKRYASGVYICRIIAGDFVKTIKMSLVK
ncbi:MAG: T9SS type A sorting domain-containing protein [Ignavibacteriales bacterium]|nr:T9SS type A sorting domain-containing protein [Ignavibacteriales bacterium]